MKADKNIKFFFIDREINDVIVSHFHHFKIRSKLKLKGSKFGFGLEQCGACLIIVDLEVDDFGNIKLKRAIIVADAVKLLI